MRRAALSFGAHPDDIEIGCGGTESVLIARGFEVTHVVATSGESGSLAIPPAELAAIREREAREAADQLGVKDVEFLRYPDGMTHPTREMKIEIVRLLRRIRPEIVFVHASPDRFPDHRVLHDLVAGALAAAAGPWYSEAGSDPHRVGTAYGYEVWHPIPEPQAFVDISSVIETKLSALRCHRSQMHPVAYDDACLGLARYRGAMGRKGRYAEAFEVIRSEVVQ